MRSLVLIPYLLPFLATLSSGQDWRSYQARLETVAKDTAPAVLAIMSNTDEPSGVRGSAFVISDDGYFLTAAHVLSEYKPQSGQLTVIFRQKGSDNGSGQWFDLIEKDDKLDVALCKIPHFAQIKKIKNFGADLGSLALSSRTLRVGHLVVIAGFPLGSWNPSIQAGHIAADHTILPLGGVAGLFQVSVAGNQGDSGGPVIDLENGKVIGIIVRGSINFSPAQQGVTVQSSGLMYALPISRISDLLARHQILTGRTIPLRHPAARSLQKSLPSR